MKLSISANGTVEALYTEKVDLDRIGAPTGVRRASHVEPVGTKWAADLSPEGGPTLGPFDKRSEALAAEAKWLEDNVICPLTGRA